MNIDYHQQLKRQFMIANVISYTIFIAVFIFGIISYSATQSGTSARSPQDIETLRMIFAFVSIAAVGSIRFMKGIISKRKTSHLFPGKDAPPQLIAISQLFSAHVFVCGVCELPALLGMVLTMSSKNMNDYYMFAAVSIVALLFNLPKYRQWEGQVNRKKI